MLLAATLAGGARADAERDVEHALIAADEARLEAMAAADTAALGRLLGAELSYVHSSGQLQTKAELLGEIGSGERRYHPARGVERSAHGFGCAGVVTALGSFEVEMHGQQMHPRLRYTATYVLRDGRWVLVAYQSTQLPAAAARAALQPAGSNLSTTPLMQ
jgi:hypothetical protein